MSGGIDSALVSCIAVDALGYEKVRLLALPSQYNSIESLNDAQQCSDNLNIKLNIFSIKSIFENLNLH